LLENTNAKQQKQLNELKLQASLTGLKINAQKTVQMRLNLDPNKSPPEKLQLNGEPIEIVDEFKYLGSYMSSTQSDIKVSNRQGIE